MTRRFEYSDSKSSKFWEITVDGAAHTVRYGRIGTAGQSKTKTLDSSGSAAADAEKLIRQKVKKGYVEKSGSEDAGGEDVADSTRASKKSEAEKKATGRTEPAKKRTGPTPTESAVWTRLDGRIPGFQHSDASVYEATTSRGMLAFRAGDAAHLYDVSLETWRLTASIERPFPLDRIKLCEDRLILAGTPHRGEGGLSIHDVRDGKTLFERSLSAEELNVGLRGDDLFIAHDEGIDHLDLKTSELKRVGFVPHPQHPEIQHGMYDSYGKDVVVGERYVYVAGRHVGVNVFRRGEDNELTFIKRVGPRYTPTFMTWLEPERSLLLLGDAHVLVVDVSKPEKPKKLPTVSFKKGEVECGALVGDALQAVVRPIGRDDKLILAAIELTPAPKLLGEQTFDLGDEARPRVAVMNKQRLSILFTKQPPALFEFAGIRGGARDRFARALAQARAGENASVLAETLDALEALDIEGTTRKIASDLETAFEQWERDCKDTPLSVINFEWPGAASYPPDYGTMGYGYAEDESSVFDCSRGFDVGFAFELVDELADETESEDDENRGAVEELRTVASHLAYQVVANAFEIAVKSESFARLNKAATLTFTMNSHDDSPVEVYSCESQP